MSSKDKHLPPIPSPLPSPLAGDDILQSKTLKRKNFKQLSLGASDESRQPTSPSLSVSERLRRSNSTNSDSDSIKSLKCDLSGDVSSHSQNSLHTPHTSQYTGLTPTHSSSQLNYTSSYLSQDSSSYSTDNATRITLDKAPNTDKATQIIAPAQPTSPSSILKFSPSSLRQKRNKIRPTPILNLNLPSKITNQVVLRTTPTTSLSLNINQSNRDVDPETNSNNDVILSQLSSLELSNRPTDYPAGKGGRKRQTVISSISPTKSTSSSPLEPRQFDSPDPTSLPIATTSLIKLNNNDLVTLKSLGSGNSGTVLKILHIPTQKTMAKKIIHIDLKTVIKTQIIRELKILHECQSPFIIEFYGAFVNNNNTIVICMEYCNCGSLDKILPLCELKQFPLYVLKKLSFAILSGLTYLYTTHKIIHRDVKPSNVLMTHKGEFKLCDFGVSRELTNSLAMADTFVGTSTYMSPERIQGLNYGVKSDIWSMGLMLIELASGLQVWNDDDEQIEAFSGNGGPEGILDLLQRIVNETPPSLAGKVNPKTGEKYNPVLCKFIDLCLAKNDLDRRSPWDLLGDKDGFLSGVEEGIYDREMKAWAKGIRKSHTKTA